MPKLFHGYNVTRWNQSEKSLVFDAVLPKKKCRLDSAKKLLKKEPKRHLLRKSKVIEYLFVEALVLLKVESADQGWIKTVEMLHFNQTRSSTRNYCILGCIAIVQQSRVQNIEFSEKYRA